MKDFLTTLVAICITIGICAFFIWLEIYHFQDCRRVGHRNFYCITDIFR